MNENERMNAEMFTDLLLRLETSKIIYGQKPLVTHDWQSMNLTASPFFKELEQISYIDSHLDTVDFKKNLKYSFINYGSRNMTAHSVVEVTNKKLLRGRVPEIAYGLRHIYEWIPHAFGSNEVVNKKSVSDAFYLGRGAANNTYFLSTKMRQDDPLYNEFGQTGTFVLSSSQSMSNSHEAMWHVKIWFDKFGVITAINPATARFFFANRDVSFGKTRKSSIRNFVEEHDRWIESQKDYILIKEHLRGAMQFKWHALNVEIQPSEFDLRRLGYHDHRKEVDSSHMSSHL